jgi:MFS family permease
MNETPLSWKLKITILSLFTTHTLGSNMIPVFIGYMVHDLIKNYTKESDLSFNVAFYTGMVETCNKAMSIFGSIFWGYVSDHINRKNTLIIVLVGNLVSFMLLGFSNDYWIAFTARGLAGIFSGIIPVSKAFIKTVTDDTNDSVLFGYCGK